MDKLDFQSFSNLRERKFKHESNAPRFIDTEPGSAMPEKMLFGNTSRVFYRRDSRLTEARYSILKDVYRVNSM